MEETNRHHKKPKHLGGKSNKENVSIIPKNKHIAWTYLTNGPDGLPLSPEDYVPIFNRDYVDPEYELILVKKRIKLPQELNCTCSLENNY